MFQIVPHVITDLSWKFHKNLSIHLTMHGVAHKNADAPRRENVIQFSQAWNSLDNFFLCIAWHILKISWKSISPFFHDITNKRIFVIYQICVCVIYRTAFKYLRPSDLFMLRVANHWQGWVYACKVTPSLLSGCKPRISLGWIVPTFVVIHEQQMPQLMCYDRCLYVDVLIQGDNCSALRLTCMARIR